MLLYLLKRNVKGILVNEKNRVELIDKETVLYGKPGDLVSLVPLSMQVKGITLQDLEYPLINHDLKLDDTLLAVSNVMLKETAKVQIQEGYLFVMQTRD